MIDEIFDRGYQTSRGDLNAGVAEALSHVGHALGDSLKVLHHIEWSAPWAQPKKRARRA